MNRFYFHLASKDNTIFDDKGRDFSDLAAAHMHAMLMIHKMVALDDVDWRGWSIKVTDASQRSVLSVLFREPAVVIRLVDSLATLLIFWYFFHASFAAAFGTVATVG
jgi:hypothetical protein